MSYRHGTRYGYRYAVQPDGSRGCRCPECRAWNAGEKQRLYRLRKSREGDAAQAR